MESILTAEELQAANLSREEMRREIAVMLFEQERLTLGQASRMAEMPQAAFVRLLGSRGISSLHYGVEELEEDLETLRRLERIR